MREIRLANVNCQGWWSPLQVVPFGRTIGEWEVVAVVLKVVPPAAGCSIMFYPQITSSSSRILFLGVLMLHTIIDRPGILDTIIVLVTVLQQSYT